MFDTAFITARVGGWLILPYLARERALPPIVTECPQAARYRRAREPRSDRAANLALRLADGGPGQVTRISGRVGRSPGDDPGG